jgi:ATP-binding cassette subfamily B protein
LLAPVFTLAAVGLEVLIPYVMALLIDEGIAVGDLGKVVQWGAVMMVCALLAARGKYYQLYTGNQIESD